MNVYVGLASPGVPRCRKSRPIRLLPRLWQRLGGANSHPLMPRASHGGCGPGCAPTAPRRMTGDAARTGPRSRLFPELRRPPSDGGGNALGCDDVAELPAEFRLRRIERADDVEPGVKRSAEAGRVGPAI